MPLEHVDVLIIGAGLSGVGGAAQVRERLPGKSVVVDAELFPDRICLQVTDEGIGFDPTQVPEPVRPEQIGEACGRGLFLIRKLVDEVHFNEQGNSICMTLRRR